MDYLIVIEEEVDVDDSIVINAVYALMGAPHFEFYSLRDVQYFINGYVGHDLYCGVKKGMRRLKAYGGCLNGRSAVGDLTDVLLYELDRALDVGVAIAEIGAKRKV